MVTSSPCFMFLVATNSIPFVLRELQAQVSCDWSAAGLSAHL